MHAQSKKRSKIDWENEFLRLSRKERKASEYQMARDRTRLALYSVIVSTCSLLGTLLLILARITGWF